MSFWFQTGSRAPCNGCRITAWGFFKVISCSKVCWKFEGTWRFFSSQSAALSLSLSRFLQFQQGWAQQQSPRWSSLSLRKAWHLEMLNSNLFRNGESQQTKHNQTSTLQLIRLQETLVHDLSCLLILAPGSPLYALFRQLICNKVLLQSPSKSPGQPAGYWRAHFFSCQDVGWPPHFLAACLVVSRKAKLLQLKDSKLPNVQKSVWAAAAPQVSHSVHLARCPVLCTKHGFCHELDFSTSFPCVQSDPVDRTCI